MPYTPSPVESNFALVLEYAKQEKKVELTALINEIKTVNFIFGLERPIERLAFEGHDKAVIFLIENFDGNLDSAVRGYARANNKTAVEALLRSGASIHYAAMGYAMAENTDAKEQVEEGEGEEKDPAADLLHRGAHRSWVSVGLARAGKQEALLAFHYRRGDEYTLWRGITLRFEHIFRGCALGRHVQLIEDLLVVFYFVIQSAGNRDAIRASLVRGYAQINDQDLLERWLEPVTDRIKIALLEGYAEGGHLAEAKEVYTSHFANSSIQLMSLLKIVAFGGHVNQAHEVLAHAIATNAATLHQTNAYLLDGFVAANIINEVSAKVSEDKNIMAAIYAYFKNEKYSELEKLWNKYYIKSPEMKNDAYFLAFIAMQNPAYFQDSTVSIQKKFIYIDSMIRREKEMKYRHLYVDRHYGDKFESDLRYMRAASTIRNNDFKNFLIDLKFPSHRRWSHLIEAMDVITKNMHDNFLSFEESINLNIPRQMERYNLAANPLRVWRACAKLSGLDQSVDCFSLFKNILPGLTKNFKVVTPVTLLIAAYLLPKVCWNVVTLPNQVSLYQLAKPSLEEITILARQIRMFTIDDSKAIPAVTGIPLEGLDDLGLYPTEPERSKRAIQRTMDKIIDTICLNVTPINAIPASSSSASMNLHEEKKSVAPTGRRVNKGKRKFDLITSEEKDEVHSVEKVKQDSYTFRTNFRTEIGRFFIHTKKSIDKAFQIHEQEEKLLWHMHAANGNSSDSEDSSYEEKLDEHKVSP